MSWLSKLRNVFRSGSVSRDLDEELRFHMESRARDLGLTAEQVRRRFGNPLALREESRDVKLAVWLETLVQDLRHGIRLLGKSPMVTVAAVLSLSLAIGACTAVFALVDALIFRPLPVVEPERLVYLTFPVGAASAESDSFSYPLFQQMREGARQSADVFSMGYQHPRAIDAGGTKEFVRVQFVSGDAFPILGVRPALGRLLTAEDDRTPGAHPVAVISHAFWTRRFGKDPVTLGRSITVKDQVVRVIGVAEERFTGAEVGVSTDLWLPNMMWAREAFTQYGWSWFRVWARLKPGVTTEQAREALQAIFTNHRRERTARFRPDQAQEKERYLNTRLTLRPAVSGPSGLRVAFERPLWIVAAVVGLVLLIACANVANLLLARARTREREMAVRVAIGASRARLIRQLIVESSLLALLASAAGIVLALWAAPQIVRLLAPSDAPAWLAVGADWRVLSFLAAVGATATLLFGLVPGLRASAASPGAAMKGDGNRVVKLASSRMLVASQVGFCFMVLFVAGLFVMSFRKLATMDPGFTADRLVLVELTASGLRGHKDAPVYWEQLRERVRALPGVTNASYSGWGLLSGNSYTGDVRVNGTPFQGEETHFLSVSPDFCETMRIAILSGREFGPRDAEVPWPTAAIVNESFAKRFFNGENPVGKGFEHYNRRDGRLGFYPYQIVGLVRDTKYNNLRKAVPPTVFFPMRGENWGVLEIRTGLDPASITSLLNRELPRIHSSFQIDRMTTQATLVDNQMIRERLLAAISGFFAILATMLAAVGLYGVLNYTVAQRTKEIGLRMALGADARKVIGLVTRDVIWMVLAGVGVGLAGGFAVQRFIESLLYEVKATDPIAAGLPTLLLVTAAILATLPPAIRAARVDPAVALRDE